MVGPDSTSSSGAVWHPASMASAPQYTSADRPGRRMWTRRSCAPWTRTRARRRANAGTRQGSSRRAKARAYVRSSGSAWLADARRRWSRAWRRSSASAARAAHAVHRAAGRARSGATGGAARCGGSLDAGCSCVSRSAERLSMTAAAMLAAISIPPTTTPRRMPCLLRTKPIGGAGDPIPFLRACRERRDFADKRPMARRRRAELRPRRRSYTHEGSCISMTQEGTS